MKANQIKSYLKENGIDTKHVRITTKSSINVKLLDPKLDYEKIDTLLKEKYEFYQRCESTGEILSGGNTFVFVSFSQETISEIREEISKTLPEFMKSVSGHWDKHSLAKHYTNTQNLPYNPKIVKQAAQEALYHFDKR